MEYNTRSKIADNNSDAIILEGFDKAIVGISECGRVIYQVNKMVSILIKEHDMDEDMAVEYLDFNVISAHFGDYTPIYLIEL